MGDPGAALPGADLGPYRLGERLGAGGMGAVYLAEHRATGHRCAVKLLPPASDPEAVLRFAREGEAMAAVRHPNVATVHATGEADGRRFLVLEHLAGGDLARRLRTGPLPVREAAAVVRDLAGGLAAVHARGVLHRDLKPANVLFDEQGTPKLVDFGLARLAAPRRLTATGEVFGTPAYMAPEATRGDPAAVDERTDVYGLGAVLYEALTGRPPFTGKTPFAVLEQVHARAPAPAEALRPEVDAGLARLCRRALAKDPAARFPDAAALGRALDDWLAGRRPAGRRRLVAVAAGLGVGAAVLAAALALEPGASPDATPAPSGAPPAAPAGDGGERRADPWTHRLPAPTGPLAEPEAEAASVGAVANGGAVFLGAAPSGTRLLTWGLGSQAVRVHHLEPEVLLRTYPLGGRPAALASNGRRGTAVVAYFGSAHPLRELDLATGDWLQEVPAGEGGSDTLRTVAADPSGERLTFAIDFDDSGAVLVRPAAQLDGEGGQLYRPGGPVADLALSTTHLGVVTSAGDQAGEPAALRRWTLADGLRGEAEEHLLDGAGTAVALSARQRFVAAGQADGRVTVLDGSSLAPVARHVAAGAVTDLAFLPGAPDRLLVASRSRDGPGGAVVVLAVARRRADPSLELRFERAAPIDVAPAPDGIRAAVTLADGRVEVWGLAAALVGTGPTASLADGVAALERGALGTALRGADPETRAGRRVAGLALLLAGDPTARDLLTGTQDEPARALEAAGRDLAAVNAGFGAELDRGWLPELDPALDRAVDAGRSARAAREALGPGWPFRAALAARVHSALAELLLRLVHLHKHEELELRAGRLRGLIADVVGDGEPAPRLRLAWGFLAQELGAADRSRELLVELDPEDPALRPDEREVARLVVYGAELATLRPTDPAAAVRLALAPPLRAGLPRRPVWLGVDAAAHRNRVREVHRRRGEILVADAWRRAETSRRAERAAAALAAADDADAAFAERGDRDSKVDTVRVVALLLAGRLDEARAVLDEPNALQRSAEALLRGEVELVAGRPGLALEAFEDLGSGLLEGDVARAHALALLPGRADERDAAVASVRALTDPTTGASVQRIHVPWHDPGELDGLLRRARAGEPWWPAAAR